MPHKKKSLNMNLSNILAHPEVTLIDVRESFEFSMGHVPGTLNIPLGTIPGKVQELKALPGPLVLYCRSGNRSGQAVAFLKAHGLKEVYNGISPEDIFYYQSQLKAAL